MTDIPSAAIPHRRPTRRARRALAELVEQITDADPELHGAAPEVSNITADSGKVTDGSLFVAIRGTRTDGHSFIGEAVDRGASAVVVERDYRGGPEIPTVRTDNTRRALAELAAAWHDRPADHLLLAGITGTFGKTSTLSMLDAILAASGTRSGSIGSLGLHVNGEAVEKTVQTAPDPLILHGELARILEEDCRIAAMEVTSHALVQERVHGLEFDLGVFTSLVPLEHADYHGSFRNYIEAKSRFLHHLGPCAPLIFNADDRGVRRLVRSHPARKVGCGTSRTAVVRVEQEEISADGTRLTLNVRRSLSSVGGDEIAPRRLPLEVSLLGRSNLGNAALAATAALHLGATPDAVREALATFPAPWRRMQILHRGRFTVLDDTVGHPDSISALFEVVEGLDARRVHAAYAARGQRGARINRQNAEAFVAWSDRVPLATLALTRSEDIADPRNRVEDEELEAVREPLREHGLEFEEYDRVEAAVRRVLERAGDGDLVLLLGAQGMDGGQEVALEWLGKDAAS